jgi:hypothetical protein
MLMTAIIERSIGIPGGLRGAVAVTLSGDMCRTVVRPSSALADFYG